MEGGFYLYFGEIRGSARARSMKLTRPKSSLSLVVTGALCVVGNFRNRERLFRDRFLRNPAKKPFEMNF